MSQYIFFTTIIELLIYKFIDTCKSESVFNV